MRGTDNRPRAIRNCAIPFLLCACVSLFASPVWSQPSELDRLRELQQAAADVDAKLEAAGQFYSTVRDLVDELPDGLIPESVADRMAAVDDQVAALEAQREEILTAVDSIAPEIVGPDGSVDWGRGMTLLAPAVSGIPVVGQVLSSILLVAGAGFGIWRQWRRARHAELSLDGRTMLGESVLMDVRRQLAAIDAAKEQEPEAWKRLAPVIAHNTPDQAKQRVRAVRGKAWDADVSVFTRDVPEDFEGSHKENK